MCSQSYEDNIQKIRTGMTKVCTGEKWRRKFSVFLKLDIFDSFFISSCSPFLDEAESTDEVESTDGAYRAERSNWKYLHKPKNRKFKRHVSLVFLFFSPRCLRFLFLGDFHGWENQSVGWHWLRNVGAATETTWWYIHIWTQLSARILAIPIIKHENEVNRKR